MERVSGTRRRTGRQRRVPRGGSVPAGASRQRPTALFTRSAAVAPVTTHSAYHVGRHGIFAPPSELAASSSHSAVGVGTGIEHDKMEVLLLGLQDVVSAPLGTEGRETAIVTLAGAVRAAGITADEARCLALHLLDAGLDPVSGALVGREAAYRIHFGERPRVRVAANATSLPGLLEALRADDPAHVATLSAFLKYSSADARLPLFVAISPVLRHAFAGQIQAFVDRLQWLIEGPTDRRQRRAIAVRALLSPPVTLEAALEGFRAIRDRLPSLGVAADQIFDLAAVLEVGAARVQALVQDAAAEEAGERLMAVVRELPLRWLVRFPHHVAVRDRRLVLADLEAVLAGTAVEPPLPQGMGLDVAARQIGAERRRRARARFQVPEGFARLRAELDAVNDGSLLAAIVRAWPEAGLPVDEGGWIARDDVVRRLKQLFPAAGAPRGSYLDLPDWLRPVAKRCLEARQPATGSVSSVDGRSVDASPAVGGGLEQEWRQLRERMRRIEALAAAWAGPQPGWRPEAALDELVAEFFAGHPVYLLEITREGQLRAAVEAVLREVIRCAERYCPDVMFAAVRRNRFTGEYLRSRHHAEEARFRLAVMAIRQHRGRDPMPGLRLGQIRAVMGVMARYFPTIAEPLPEVPEALSEGVVRRAYHEAVQALRRRALGHDDADFRQFWAVAAPAEKRLLLKAFFGPFFHLDVEGADPTVAYWNAARVIDVIGAGGCYREVGLTMWVDRSMTPPRVQFRLSVGDPSSVAGEGGDFVWLGHTHPERPQRPGHDAGRYDAGMTLVGAAAVEPEPSTYHIFPSHEIPGGMSGGDLDLIMQDRQRYETLGLPRLLGRTVYYDPETGSSCHTVGHCNGRSRITYFPARGRSRPRMEIAWALNPSRQEAGVRLDQSWRESQLLIEAWGRRHGVDIVWDEDVPYEVLSMEHRGLD